MCSEPLDLGGEVRGCSVGCTLGMSDVSTFHAATAFDVHTYEVCRTNDLHLQAVESWVRRGFSQILSSGV